MTDKTQPEALRLAEQYDYGDPVAHSNMWKAAVCNALRRQHARIAELEAELEAVGAGGVQALSAAPAWKQGSLVTMNQEPYPALGEWFVQFWEGDDVAARVYGNDRDTLSRRCAMLAASPTPPAEQQAAPKAAPGVGNSGFDHQTAADFLSGKTVSVEALRKFVHASRRAHDEKTALSAMLLSVRGELASREAEIALLKKALMEAEAAPRQEAQEPALFVSAKQLADLVDPSHATGGSYLPARKTRAGLFTQPLYTAPQPAPAPLGDDVVKDAARYRFLAGHCRSTSEHWGGRWSIIIDGPAPKSHDSEDDFDEAVDAALAAQGGKV